MPSSLADVEALVLDSRDHGESDKIVTLFCHGAGRLTCIAKGAHRSKKRFVNKLELFSFLQATCSLSARSSLAVLTDAELLDSFISLRSDVGAYRAASIFREFLLAATSERLNDDTLFQLGLWTLREMNGGAPPQAVLAVSLIKLFDYIGYRPDFSSCQVCGSALKFRDAVFFSPEAGGLLCSTCRQGGPDPGLRLNQGTRQTIVSVQQQPVNRLSRFKPSRVIRREVLDCFYRYGRHVFQKELHAWKYLDDESYK